MLKKWESTIPDIEMDFSKTQFWVQVHGLPLDHSIVDNAKRIRECFEELVDHDLARNEQSVGYDCI